MAKAANASVKPADHNLTAPVDWEKVARALFLSRKLDDIEEQKLLPERKMFYQFSGRGHDLAQILLSQRLTHAQDAAAGYYRSRPLLLGLGIPLEEVMAATLMKVGGYSDGKD